MPRGSITTLLEHVFSIHFRKVLEVGKGPSDKIRSGFASFANFGSTTLSIADAKTGTSSSNSPILVLHGKADTLVPYYMGKKIYENANEPKYSYFPTFDNHMMAYDQSMINALKNFLNIISRQ